ncbi:MAG TPA: HRDC domain-containing protein [Chitinophagales bacterium]|nr:HRDC domain-containing protein [Chitinophagales bacterium]
MEIQIKHAKLLERNFSNYSEIIDTMLLLRLKRWRLSLAKQKNVPAYLILHNKDLYMIVKAKPKSLDALSDLEGFGKKRVELYGKIILELIQQHKIKLLNSMACVN